MRVAVVTSRPEEADALAAVLGDEAEVRRFGPEEVGVPAEQGTWFSVGHAYAGAVWAALRGAYGGEPPDLIELDDRTGAGAVVVQAARTRDPWLAGTTVATRANGTPEMRAMLDGHLPAGIPARADRELARYCVRFADVLLDPGGDVRGTYARVHGERALAPRRLLAPAAGLEADPAPPPPEGPLRLLHLGGYARHKGALNLVRALTADDTDRFRLTITGPDARTAPLGAWSRDVARVMAAGDERIELRDEAVIADHHAVVVPSLWDAWPREALRAHAAGRAVLGTPVGGLVELADEVAAGTDPGALLALLDRIGKQGLPDPAPLPDDGAVREGYRALAAERPRAPRAHRRPAPLVTIVVPYFKLDAHVEETVASALAQTHERVEVVVVNDGSLRDEDRGLADLEGVDVVTQPNSGLGAARNFGIALARGRYVVPLDADDVLEPAFVERCLAALEHDDAIAYACCWTRYVHEDGTPIDLPGDGFNPVSNAGGLVHEQNIAGHATALLRRSVFDGGLRYETELTGYEDWTLYRALHDAGHIGHVVPERLMRYRVRPGSMLREAEERRADLLAAEAEAHLRRGRVVWTA